MKIKNKLLLPFLILGCAVFLNTSSSFYMPFHSDYNPVFMERSELERSVFFDEKGRDLVNPGKIYSKDQFIFINEKYAGIHIIDNSTPSSPRQVGFIVAPGCIDLAVKSSTLYLDNAVDLVAFNLETRQVTERIQNVFPEPISPDNRSYYGSRPDKTVLVGWNKKTE